MTDNKAADITPSGEFGIYIEKRRIAAKLTQRELGAAIKVSFQKLTELLTGQKAPSRLNLERLTEALGGEDLAAKFPLLKQVDFNLMERPENLPLRLKHLVNELADGNQSVFYEALGWSASVMSTLLSGKQNLTASKEEQLLQTLPQLSREWLLTGTGDPFPGSSTAEAKAALASPAPPTQKKQSGGQRKAAAAEAQAFDDELFNSTLMRHIQRMVEPVQTEEVVVRVAPFLQMPQSLVRQEPGGSSSLDITALVQMLDYLVQDKCGLTAAQTETLYQYFFPS